MSQVHQSFGFPLSAGVLSDVGRMRSNNEDSVGYSWLDDGSLLVMVADGMGGHEAGEVASSLAVQVVEESISMQLSADPRERIYQALLEANEVILEEGRRSDTSGMGTTSVVGIIQGQKAYIGLVGDSRCYHFRKGHMLWRTSDHTRVQMLVHMGQLTEAESRTHPEAGMLTRALGHALMADGQRLVPDVLESPIIIERDDSLVLCSDGLHDLLDDDEIGQAIAGKTAEEATACLVEMACERGGHDNVTVAVVHAGERAAAYDPTFEADLWQASFAPRSEPAKDTLAEPAPEAGTGADQPPPGQGTYYVYPPPVNAPQHVPLEPPGYAERQVADAARTRLLVGLLVMVVGLGLLGSFVMTAGLLGYYYLI